MQFWKSREERKIARLLRRDRHEPAGQLQQAIEQRVRGAERRGRPTPRVGVALGVSAALAVAFAGVGGAGYAATAARKAGAAVTHVTVAPKPTTKQRAASPAAAGKSSSNDQYGPERLTICHRTPSGKATTLVLPPPAAGAHLRQHGGDTPGACAAG